jgi:hypothetical protein
MSDHIIKTIEQLKDEIAKVEEAVRPKKSLANQLCEMAGIPPAYSGIDDPSAAPQPMMIRRNAFYGKPLSTCMKEILEMRVNLPVKEATLEEIFAGLKQGGYDLDASGANEADQKRGVSIALGKNSQTFHRVASGDYGLVAWYPNIREKRAGPPPRSAPVVPTASETPKNEDPTVKYARALRETASGSPRVFTTEGGPEEVQ